MPEKFIMQKWRKMKKEILLLILISSFFIHLKSDIKTLAMQMCIYVVF
jgi:hypothetical protein